jgi:hypothetical protein
MAESLLHHRGANGLAMVRPLWSIPRAGVVLFAKRRALIQSFVEAWEA